MTNSIFKVHLFYLTINKIFEIKKKKTFLITWENFLIESQIGFKKIINFTTRLIKFYANKSSSGHNNKKFHN